MYLLDGIQSVYLNDTLSTSNTLTSNPSAEL